MCCSKPFVQRDMASLVQRVDRHRKRLATSVALIQTRTMRLASHECGLIHDAAVRANRAIRPNACFKPLSGFVFVMENRLRKVAHGCIPQI